MTQDEIIRILKIRPAIHKLVYGAFFQEPMYFSKDIFILPLPPLGYKGQAEYLAQYYSAIRHIKINLTLQNSLIKQGENSFPVISIICFVKNDNESPEKLEKDASNKIEHAKRILSWATGNRLLEFGSIVLSKKNNSIRTILPQTKKRTRLGFGNTGSDFESFLNRINELSERNEHFSFALSLLYDANFENNPKFRIARYFNCLECLAYKYKKELPSRKAIKKMIGLEKGAISEISIENKKYRYDVIEIAGRIRDKLFHGTEFKREDLKLEFRNAFELYELHPEEIASSMQSYCEIEMLRWTDS